MSMQYETKLWKTKPAKHLYEDPVYLLKVLKFTQRKFCKKKKDVNKIDAKNAVLRRKIFFSFELHSTKGLKTLGWHGVTRKRLLSLDLKPFR